MQKTKKKETLLFLYNKLLPALATSMHARLAPITPLFHDFLLERVVDTWTKSDEEDWAEPVSLENGNVQHLFLRLNLAGFQGAGDPFDISTVLLFSLQIDDYVMVGPDKSSVWLEKQYDQAWTEQEIEETTQRWCDQLLDEINLRLGRLL